MSQAIEAYPDLVRSLPRRILNAEIRGKEFHHQGTHVGRFPTPPPVDLTKDIFRTKHDGLLELSYLPRNGAGEGLFLVPE
jgi:hypothetical protein